MRADIAAIGGQAMWQVLNDVYAATSTPLTDLGKIDYASVTIILEHE